MQMSSEIANSSTLSDDRIESVIEIVDSLIEAEE